MAHNINAKFETSSEGFSATGVALATYHDAGGQPDGYLGLVDTDLLAVNYYQASSEFTGHKLNFFGGKLSYDIMDSGSDLSGQPDVEIVGRDGTMLVAAVGQAGTDWTHMAIDLNASGDWRIGSLDGPQADNGDIKHVLKDVSQVLIRGDYSTGIDIGGLDNVKLAPPPKHHASGHAAYDVDAGDDYAAIMHHSLMSADSSHVLAYSAEM